MNEAETRTEHIGPALKGAGRGVGEEGSQLVTSCHQLPLASRAGLKKP
jgi:hypothetical protein